MKLLDLIFELVLKFVPMKEADWAKMKEEAEMDVREWHPEHKNKLKAMYAKYNGFWWFKLLVACAYIPLVRALTRYQNVENSSEDED